MRHDPPLGVRPGCEVVGSGPGGRDGKGVEVRGGLRVSGAGGEQRRRKQRRDRKGQGEVGGLGRDS